MKYGQTWVEPEQNYIFCRKSFKSWIYNSKSIWSVHFIALYILCWHTIMCRKFFLHISVCTHWRATSICVQLSHSWTRYQFARQCESRPSPVHTPIVVTLSIEPQSRQNSFSRLVYLSVSSRGGPSNLVQKSHVDKKSVRPILWTLRFSKDNFMKSWKKSLLCRNLVHLCLLAVSEAPICFMKFLVWMQLIQLNWIKLVD